MRRFISEIHIFKTFKISNYQKQLTGTSHHNYPTAQWGIISGTPVTFCRKSRNYCRTLNDSFSAVDRNYLHVIYLLIFLLNIINF